MIPDPRFYRVDKAFWANVSSISESIGYATRSTKENPKGGLVKVPTISEMCSALHQRNLSSLHIADARNNPTELGQKLLDYYSYRAHILNNDVQNQLMNADEARKTFESLYEKYNPRCLTPMNKQTGEKKAPAYFTGIINMLVEANSPGFVCDYDPHHLTTITKDNKPLRTLARRVDGAFPSTVNPVAIWEVKEYYYTTTFGSRVADGIYETLLDGMELEELQEHESIDVKHYLMVDAKLTWWGMGKSYLCRIVDMLHMGYVDEVLFGREVLTRLPFLVQEWVKIQIKSASLVKIS